jgi:hypothetical protein
LTRRKAALGLQRLKDAPVYAIKLDFRFHRRIFARFMRDEAIRRLSLQAICASP